MYRVIVAFCDLKDNNHSYDVGETYPRKGLRVSAARYAELSGSENRMGFPLIKAVEGDTTRKPKRKGVTQDA